MKRQFIVTLTVGDDDQTRSNIWRDWVEGALREALERVPPSARPEVEVDYPGEGAWYVSAYVHTGPGLGTEPATLAEVRAAIEWLGLDVSLVEQIDEGAFHIPLPISIESQVHRDGFAAFEAKGIEFAIETP